MVEIHAANQEILNDNNIPQTVSMFCVDCMKHSTTNNIVHIKVFMIIHYQNMENTI